VDEADDLQARTDAAKANFIKTEIRTGLMFIGFAERSPSLTSRAYRERAKGNATDAFYAVRRFLPLCTRLKSEDRAWIAENLQLLWKELKRIGVQEI
jgi:hypothetical protein